ncbi:MAG: cell division protein FtsX [Sulfurovum sp.]|nr:cell division protein FtsX [Sulfurovum sp.]
MKYIKDHIMFIFPMLAILFGIESFIVFDRMSKSYEQELRADYSMLVLTSKPMELSRFKKLDGSISSVDIMEKRSIVEEMAKGMSGISAEDIMQSLPYFYTVHLGKYLDAKAIEKIRGKLIASEDIKSVETFDQSHNSSYNLFLFIKIVLWVFVGFMTLSSLFLVIKQMEIWQFSHKERMQVMEIFGASTMLRSGILFKRAIIDAVMATILTSALFAFLRFVWVERSNIEILTKNKKLLFEYQDIAILGSIAMLIVIVAVTIVVVGNREGKL